MKESSASTHGRQGTAQTLRWSHKRIILSTGHYEDLTEVELSSWLKGSSLKYKNSLKKQNNFNESSINFF